MTNPFLAEIREGSRRTIDDINVRSGPSTDFDIDFEFPTGHSNLPVLDVKHDEKKEAFQGKTYNWFQLRFPDGKKGWVRDDLINVVGDGSDFGYGVVTSYMFALELKRARPNPERTERILNDNNAGTVTSTENSTSIVRSTSTTIDVDRVVAAAFNITAAFEGSGYSSYQTYDHGLISYGRFQFTLLGNGLENVLKTYIDLSPDGDHFARAFKRDYLARVEKTDKTLRDDRRFEMMLRQAARTAAMKEAQDTVAFNDYWLVMKRLSIDTRRVRTPLSKAMFFDISIQHGPRHDIFGTVERQLGFNRKIKLDQDNVEELDFIRRSANERRRILYAIASAQNLPGVRVRADFWLKLIDSMDVDLKGDTDGNIIANGRRVQVRNP